MAPERRIRAQADERNHHAARGGERWRTTYAASFARWQASPASTILCRGGAERLRGGCAAPPCWVWFLLQNSGSSALAKVWMLWPSGQRHWTGCFWWPAWALHSVRMTVVWNVMAKLAKTSNGMAGSLSPAYSLSFSALAKVWMLWPGWKRHRTGCFCWALVLLLTFFYLIKMWLS